MKLDDRFITIFTVLLILLGVGAVVQNGGLFGGDGSYAAADDSFTVRAGRSQPLDVLLNDSNVDRIDPATLRVVDQPRCGSAEPFDGKISFTAAEDCEGNFSFTYCVPADGACVPASVAVWVVQVRSSRVVTAGAGAARLTVADPQRSTTSEQPQQPMSQPMRLTVPSGAEVVTPQDATQGIRDMARSDTPRMDDALTADDMARVSDSAAQGGAISVAGIDMPAPEPVRDGPELMLSGAADADPRSASGRQAIAGLAAPVRAPDMPGQAAVAPETPAQAAEAPGASRDPAPLVGEPPVLPVLAATTADAEVPLPPAELALPDRAFAGRLAVPAATPPPLPVVPLRPEEARIAAAPPPDAAPVDPDSPEAQTLLSQFLQPQATETSALPPIGAAAGLGAVPRMAPEVTAPDEELEIAAAVSGPAGRPAVPGGPLTFAPAGPAEQAIVTRVPGSEPMMRSGDPQRPSVRAEVFNDTAPDPSISALPPPPPPDNSVLGSLARSNTILGATISAARALFGGGDAGTAPPPRQPLQLPPAVTAGAGPALTAPGAESQPGAIAALRPVGPSATVLPRRDASEQCEVSLSLQVQVGAEIVGSLSSPCRAERRFLVEHAGLTFTAETDGDGVADFIVPAMQSDALVRARFDDGGAAVARTVVEGMLRMSRIAVVWSHEADIDLHALEGGAAAGSDGHVWAGNPRNFRLARRMGGGYLTRLGPEEGSGVRAEVYTLFETLRTDPGAVALSLQGDETACAGSPEIRVLRSERARLLTDSGITIDAAECSGARIAESVTGLEDIRVARED